MSKKKKVRIKVRAKKGSVRKTEMPLGTDCFDSCKGACTRGNPCSTG